MGKIAIVTGGTRGIGRAICERLIADGFTVVANYAGNEEAARACAEDLGVATYKWDVGDHQACLQGCARVSEEVGPVEVLVNNAGITRDGTLAKMSYDDWHDVMRINLGGCFNMAKACFPGMKERGWGRIVNIGSINGQAGQYGQVNYAAAKSGIHGFTKALARQEGARFGIPVGRDGERDRARLRRYRHGRRRPRPRCCEKIVAGSPPDRRSKPVPTHVGPTLVVIENFLPSELFGRLGQAHEIARGVAFLVAEEGGFVTGSTMSINGGQHCMRRVFARGTELALRLDGLGFAT